MFAKLFKKKQPVHTPTPINAALRLAHDDRHVIYETEDAEVLARAMLADAEQEYKDKRPGFDVTLVVPMGYAHVHHMELQLMLMNIDHEYGFRTGMMFSNEVHLTKL